MSAPPFSGMLWPSGLPTLGRKGRQQGAWAEQGASQLRQVEELPSVLRKQQTQIFSLVLALESPGPPGRGAGD